MQNFYLLDYIKDNRLHVEKNLWETIWRELDQHIYYYGKQFKYPKEKDCFYYSSVKKNIKDVISLIFLLHKLSNRNNIFNSKKNIISNAYFSTNKELKKLGYNVFCPIWWVTDNKDILSDLHIFQNVRTISKTLIYGAFNEVIDSRFLQKIQDFKDYLKKFYLKNYVDSLFVPNDVSFFENLSINVFKEIQKPSFICLHGLPGCYNNIDNNRTNYLIVWGDKIKQHFMDAGINKDKIYVSGHPFYQKPSNPNLRNNLGSILVITKSINGNQHSDAVRLSDRGNCILFLFSVQSVLQKFGVKRVRLRLHPSENTEWYLKFIDNKFYQIDREALGDSLLKSTLVLGPTSTVFLESLYWGVNYICYEPSIKGLDLMNYPLVPPFDGSDARVPVALNEEELEYYLKDRASVDASIFRDYIREGFDMGFLKNLI